MDDDDSHQEFERFLQEDDDSTSMSASFQGTTAATSSKRATSATAASQRKQSSSAAAVTAALLAPSKLLGKSSSAAATKKKSSTKKETSGKAKKSAVQSDSEEEPPPYTARRGSRRVLDADPYAFDLDSSFHLKEDDEESDDIYSSSKKKKKKEEKEPKKKVEPVKREQAKPVVSLEDRVAQILKRTGSSAMPPPKAIDERQSKRSDEEEDGDAKSRRSGDSDSDHSEKSVPHNPSAARQAARAPAEKKAEAQDNGSDEGSEYDSKRLSLSDSLGMESADFESSLNSEKFAVNVDAMEESELTTNPRYPTQNDTSFSAKSYDDDEDEPDPDGDDYEDEGFELDQTTVGGMELAPMTSYAESYLGKSDGFETSKSDADTSFVSQFEKMKELFSLDSSFDPAAIDARKEEAAAESVTREKSVEYATDNDNFGYEDEDFEPDEGVVQTEDTPVEQTGEAESSDQKAADAIADLHLQKEAKQDDAPATLTELSSRYLHPLVDADETGSHTPAISQPVEDSSKVSNAIDGDARPSETCADEVDEQGSERTSPGFLQPSQPPESFTEMEVESPPMSPPPPPPPDDEDAEDDELNSFTLDRGAAIQHGSAMPSSLMETATTVVRTQGHSMERATTVDRFQHFQSHVSALRIIEAPRHTTSHNREKQIAHRKQRKNPVSPAVEPAVPPIDLDEESKEIEDFLRQSRRLKQERQQMQAVRSSASKENELALRLQQAQRQILQLKRHIQESEGDEESVEGEDDSVASVSSPLAITIEASEEVKKNTAVRSSHRRGDLNKDEEAHHAISASGLAKMKKEIQVRFDFMICTPTETQDTLIQAYQKENEQLMRQLKKIQQGVQYDAHVENEHLKKQLKEMRERLEHRDAADGGVDITNMGQYRLAVEARLHAEAHALSLQEELAAARATHQQRENELKLSLDRAKKAKVELECRYEGIDLAKIADETKLVKKLQSDLALTKKESEHALASLQKKLDWYVENQRLLDAQDEEVKRLKEETSQLKSDIQSLRSQRPNGSGTPGKPPLGRGQSQQNQSQHHHRSAADIRRINELETRLVEMEEAMRKRHPDSLVNLILASRKAEEESTIKAMDDTYQQQLKAKEEEIEQIQEANEKKLKSFRQQQEKLVLLFQRRIREQEKQLQKADLHHQHHGKSLQKRRTTTAAAVQDRDAEDEVKRVRKFYTEKIKELEKKWETKYRSLKKQQFSGGGSAAIAADGSNRELQSLSYADSTIIIANLQRQLREKEAAIKTLLSQVRVVEKQLEVSKQLRHPTAAPETNDEFTRDGVQSELLSRKNEELSAYIRSVEAQLKASEEARSHLVATLSTLQTFTMEHDDARQEVPDRSDRNSISPEAAEQLRVRITDDLTAKFRSEIDALKKSHVDELSRARETISKLEEQARDHMDALEAAQNQLRNGHAKETRQLQQQISEAEQEKRVLQELADRVPFLENEVTRLHEQLTIPRTPSMLQYRSLEMKIETLMQKHLLREAELKVLLSKATQSSELEKLQMERIHQNAIAAKNVEIRHFKKQLDDILYELELLRQPQAP